MRIVTVATLLLLTAILGLGSDKREAAAPKIPPNSKIFIASMENGLDGFLAP
jgi:hypothetical protein